jgi:hypothetical protein
MLRIISRMLVIVVSVMIVANASAIAGSRIVKSFEMAPGGEFILDTAVGKIELVGTSGSQAEIVITSTLDDIESIFDFEYVASDGQNAANRLEVIVSRKGSKRRSWFNLGRGPQLTFEIQVPQQTLVVLDTAGSAITVENIDGDVRLDTSGSSIHVTDIVGNVLADTSGALIYVADVEGNVVADTSGATIRVEHVQGEVLADTSGGSIEVQDVSGSIFADTSGGSITISEAGGHVYADTSGSGITVGFLPGNDSGGELSTSGGAVKVMLDSAVNLTIDASASGGSVVADMPVRVQGKLSNNSLRARLGAGGNSLKIRASGGSIRIQPL